MPRSTVLYDGNCGFCRWCLAKVLAWDRHSHLGCVPIQSPEGQRLLVDVPEKERLASWHLVGAAGEVSSAGAAFPPLLRELPGGRPLASAAARTPRLVDRAYRWVAGHRDVFGRMVSTGAARRANARISARLSEHRVGDPLD
jgi:predicted DCC family thiol-disulfide oxidoreductase YuxK